jgi:N-acyl-L-homoserine lactone synthetase
MGCFNSGPLKRERSRKTIFEESNYYDVKSRQDEESDDVDKRKRAFYLINQYR